MIAYIHGFNSSPASNTFGLLRRVFPDARALDYPSSGLFPENLARLHVQALALREEAGEALALAGSSLGGFYASQLSALLGCNCALFNPVVRPAQSLRQFVGPNTYFHGGQRWEFTNEMCDSYAIFFDARKTPVERLVVLGRADTLLDPAEARAYWKNHARIHETDDGHSLAALDETIINTLSAWQR
ncbi:MULTISPECIES: YqiA/YcfP family alpha/beta fold hydrolase [unclassified Desulfovibrio]|uniref:YqiA/YcfP family alpha/beta fold hydrolase n=1 Tax=unclassified Desulfovibrio TaxID=2593640 RepID=UPI002FDAD025